jgi:hypothetical protein
VSSRDRRYPLPAPRLQAKDGRDGLTDLLGRMDSNHRLAVPETAALPLGHSPMEHVNYPRGTVTESARRVAIRISVINRSGATKSA